MNTKKKNGLTRYPIASFRELVSLAFPLTLTALSSSLLSFCDRTFLSHYSQGAWKAVGAALSLTFLFQITLIMIALVGQAIIGHYKGAEKEEKIGPFVWQMIYFSLLSMVLTYPLSFFTESYFLGSEIQEEALTYFRLLMSTNFLYPLGASLASFFLGRGKNQTVLLVTITTQALNALLDYLLIFGIKGYIPPMGIKGAAIATVIAQAAYCSILFALFMKKKNIPLFNTRDKHFNLPLMWEGLKTGIPRTFGRSMVVGAWSASSYLMIQKGGDFLLVHTFGVTIFIILTFIVEGMGQAIVTIISHALGKNHSDIFHKCLRSSLLFVFCSTIIVGIPLVLMQNSVIHFFVKAPLTPSSHALLKKCCFIIWFGCFGTGINRIGVCMLTASRDTLFYALCASSQWITATIPTLYGIGMLGWSPTSFFVVDFINCLTIGTICILRFLKQPDRHLSPPTITVNVVA